MKYLYLMRHAKSSWNHPNLSDFQRPLNSRGERNAHQIGKEIARLDLRPDIVLSSPAERARQTIEIVSTTAGFDLTINFDVRIYGAGLATLSYLLNEISDSSRSVMLVGHNPGFEEILAYLVGKYRNMPTGALAIIELNVDTWRQIEGGEGELIEFICPRNLDEGGQSK